MQQINRVQCDKIKAISGSLATASVKESIRMRNQVDNFMSCVRKSMRSIMLQRRELYQFTGQDKVSH